MTSYLVTLPDHEPFTVQVSDDEVTRSEGLVWFTGCLWSDIYRWVHAHSGQVAPL